MTRNRKSRPGRARPGKAVELSAPRARPAPGEDLALIRELEDRIDLADASKALAEAMGKLVPWETVKRELGL